MATYIENEEETEPIEGIEPIEEIEQPDETEEDAEGEIYPVDVEVENGKVIYDEPFDFENRTITWSETTIYAKWIKEYSITDVEGLSGENENEWAKNSTDGATLTVKFSDENDTSFEEFVGVKLDGTLLEKDKDYTVRKGSTIVTLTPAALQDLAAGEHTITILFNEKVLQIKP